MMLSKMAYVPERTSKKVHAARYRSREALPGPCWGVLSENLAIAVAK